ncbi:MAG: Fe-S-containing hydro-lyase [Clostridiaceae bacterium]
MEIKLPISQEILENLKVGEMVYLSGTLYTARDAAHKLMVEALDKGEELPFNLKGETIYYAGPCPAKPGFPCGPAGPTTSGRMDKFTPRLLNEGLKVMIGKGERNQEVIQSIVDNSGIYLVAIGGLGALISQSIDKVEVIGYPHLGTESVKKMWINRLPVIVAVDSKGNNIYKR